MNPMLRILVSFCLIFAADKELITLYNQKLLVYTDIKEENIKISYKDLDNISEENLDIDNVTNNYNPEDFLFNSYVYSLNLPIKREGKIVFVIYDNDNNRLFQINTCFSKYDEIKNTPYIFHSFAKEISSEVFERFVCEANFTYIDDGKKGSLVCVIGDSLDKKVQLDRSLLFHQSKSIVDARKACEDCLVDALANIKSLIDTVGLSESHKFFIDSYLHKVIYKLTSLHCLLVYFESLCKSPFYEAFIIDKSCGKLQKSIVTEGFANLVKHNQSLFEQENDDIEKFSTENSSTLNSNEITMFKKSLESLDRSVQRLLEFAKTKEDRERKCIDYRNKEYSKKHSIMQKDKPDVRIQKLRINLTPIYKFMMMSNLNEIFKFVDHYVQTYLNSEDVQSEVKEKLTELRKESDHCFTIVSNLIGLQSQKPEEFFKNLTNDSKFKELTSKSIVENLSEYKKKVEEWLKFPNIKDSFLEKTLNVIFADIEHEITFWECVRNNKTDVGLSSVKPTETSKESKKEKKSTNENKKSSKIFTFLFIAALAIIVIIFISRMIKN